MTAACLDDALNNDDMPITGTKTAGAGLLILRRMITGIRTGKVRKADHGMTLKGRKGLSATPIFAVLCACGHNTRKILTHLGALLSLLLQRVAAILGQENPRIKVKIAA